MKIIKSKNEKFSQERKSRTREETRKKISQARRQLFVMLYKRQSFIVSAFVNEKLKNRSKEKLLKICVCIHYVCLSALHRHYAYVNFALFLATKVHLKFLSGNEISWLRPSQFARNVLHLGTIFTVLFPGGVLTAKHFFSSLLAALNKRKRHGRGYAGASVYLLLGKRRDIRSNRCNPRSQSGGMISHIQYASPRW